MKGTASEKQIRMGVDRMSEGNPAWKGDKATVSSIHCWVRDNFEKVNKCEHCGTETAKRYDWSNKDHKYSRNRDDWQRLCRSCHVTYDNKHHFENRKDKFKKMMKGGWSMKYDKCIKCSRSDVKHKSCGMCANCYRIEKLI